MKHSINPLTAAIAATLFGAASMIAVAQTSTSPDTKGGTTAGSPAGSATKSPAGSPTKSPAGGKALAGGDKNFAMKAAQAGIAEVSTGKIAAANASNADVKKFGEHMQQDHGKANDELMQIAQSRGIALPKEPDKKHQQAAKKLEGMKGAQFDKAYMSENVKDHKQAVALFSKQASSGKDPELKAFAEKTLPTLKQHLQMAQDLNANVAKSR